MTISRIVPVLRVSDMDAALDFYGRVLGCVTEFRYAAGPVGPHYAGVSLDGHAMHLSTFSGDGRCGAVVYFYIDDADALFRGFVARGLRTPGDAGSPVHEGPVDQSWGMREFYVRDLDGNGLRFGAALRRPE